MVVGRAWMRVDARVVVAVVDVESLAHAGATAADASELEHHAARAAMLMVIARCARFMDRIASWVPYPARYACLEDTD